MKLPGPKLIEAFPQTLHFGNLNVCTHGSSCSVGVAFKCGVVDLHLDTCLQVLGSQGAAASRSTGPVASILCWQQAAWHCNQL